MLPNGPVAPVAPSYPRYEMDTVLDEESATPYVSHKMYLTTDDVVGLSWEMTKLKFVSSDATANVAIRLQSQLRRIQRR
jgi:hypothetical protein